MRSLLNLYLDKLVISSDVRITFHLVSFKGVTNYFIFCVCIFLEVGGWDWGSVLKGKVMVLVSLWLSIKS